MNISLHNTAVALLITFLITLTTALTPAKAQSDWQPGEYMKASMVNVFKMARYFESQSQYGFVDGVCLMGAYLQKGKQVGWTGNFEAGAKYVLIGAGGSDTRDLDLRVQNESGGLVTEDVKTDNTPMVTFTPTQSGRYTVYLKLHDCVTTSDFCGMTIMKQYGNSVPAANMAESLANLLSLGRAVNTQTGVKFHDYENQWCVYGYIMNPNTSQTIQNINLGSEDHVVIAAADHACTDTDVVVRTQSGSEVGKDVSADATPIVKTRTANGVQYKIEVKNVSSTGKSLVMLAVLTS